MLHFLCCTSGISLFPLQILRPSFLSNVTFSCWSSHQFRLCNSVTCHSAKTKVSGFFKKLFYFLFPTSNAVILKITLTCCFCYKTLCVEWNPNKNISYYSHPSLFYFKSVCWHYYFSLSDLFWYSLKLIPFQFSWIYIKALLCWNKCPHKASTQNRKSCELLFRLVLQLCSWCR